MYAHGIYEQIRSLSLDDNTLRTFLTVLDENSVSRAAESLGVSQSTVSSTGSPVRFRPVNDRFQYVPELQAKFLNVRCSAYSGHPTKLLMY